MTSTTQAEPSSPWPSQTPSYLYQAYSLHTPAEARALYDSWSISYDHDLSDLDYAFPAHAASALVSALGSAWHSDLRILDAGCGTGMVGAILACEHEASNIEGIDISPGMLSVARGTKAYRELREVDLTLPLEREDASYDAVICVGTLTKGHVGPGVLSEFVRIARRGGVVCATVLAGVWESGGFKGKVEELRREGKVDVLGDGVVGLRKGEETGGILVLMRKL